MLKFGRISRISTFILISALFVIIFSVSIKVDDMLMSKDIEKDDDMDLSLMEAIRAESLGKYEEKNKNVKNEKPQREPEDEYFHGNKNEEHLQEAMTLEELNNLFGDDEDAPQMDDGFDEEMFNQMEGEL